MNYDNSNWYGSVKQEDAHCGTRTEHFDRQGCLQSLQKLTEERERVMLDLLRIDSDIKAIVNQLVSNSNTSKHVADPHNSPPPSTSLPFSQLLSSLLSDTGVYDDLLQNDDGVLAGTSEASSTNSSSSLNFALHADLPQQDQSVQVLSSASKRPAAAAGSSGAKKSKQEHCSGITFDQLCDHLSDVDSMRDEASGVLKCPACERAKETSRKCFKRHLLSHLSDEAYYPYKCPADDCDRVFLRKDNLKQHVNGTHKIPWTDCMDSATVDLEKKAALDSL